MEINKAVLDCMQSLRRRLRDEQRLDIRLSQPDAVTAMLTACLGSGDELTRELGRQLAAYTDQPTPVAIKPSSASAHVPSVRIYRGQRVMA
ncbi:hypothetical protein [Stutzerimonas marianensis]|uniref:Uncharacterized protein n=1 Tax=Stutzerimonas marianensis TaxID=2929513 RepID=A0A9X2ATF7_9GAMM|nr:hypothetical protein [Pseudomonas marianensis]MCJ0974989.1 hypothetical protein [Pseudomonas marianensis]